jgi:hypothetical protein
MRGDPDRLVDESKAGTRKHRCTQIGLKNLAATRKAGKLTQGTGRESLERTFVNAAGTFMQFTVGYEYNLFDWPHPPAPSPFEMERGIGIGG